MAMMVTIQPSGEAETYCSKHDLFSCVFCMKLPTCDDCGNPEPIVASYGTNDKTVGLYAACDRRALTGWSA